MSTTPSQAPGPAAGRTVRALAPALYVAVLLSGCGGASGTTAMPTGPDGEILLVNADSASENYAMEALFEGALVLNKGSCITGRTTEGRELALIFPADAGFAETEPLTVVVHGHLLEVGAPVALGGGGILSGGRLERIVQDAPAQCRHDETFYVQSVSEKPG